MTVPRLVRVSVLTRRCGPGPDRLRLFDTESDDDPVGLDVGSSTPVTTTTPRPTGTSTATPVGGQCATSDLSGAIGPGAGGAAGSVGVTIVLTNNGSASCELQGWPGVAFVGGGNGTQLGKPATLDRSTPHPTVTLAPGGKPVLRSRSPRRETCPRTSASRRPPTVSASTRRDRPLHCSSRAPTTPRARGDGRAAERRSAGRRLTQRLAAGRPARCGGGCRRWAPDWGHADAARETSPDLRSRAP